MARLVRVRVIRPGWGSSGYYGQEVLERDAKAIAPGTKMYLDHPTGAEERERPERSIRDLVGEIVEAGKWERDGVYALAKVYEPFASVLPEMASSIGVSIRGIGRAKRGKVGDREGPIIEEIAAIRSVDFVTEPGAGGRVVALMESAGRTNAGGHTMDTTEQATAKLRTLIEERDRALAEAAALKEQIERQRAEIEEMHQAIQARERQRLIAEAVARHEIPPAMAARVTEMVAASEAAAKDGADIAALVAAAVEAEQAYLREAVKPRQGSPVRANGETTKTSDPTVDQDRAAKAFAALGLTEAAAKRAAIGR